MSWCSGVTMWNVCFREITKTGRGLTHKAENPSSHEAGAMYGKLSAIDGDASTLSKRRVSRHVSATIQSRTDFCTADRRL